MDNLAYDSEMDGTLEKTKTLEENINPKATVENVKVYTFNEAVTLAGVGIYHYFIEITGGICLMASTVEVMGVSLVMPFLSLDIPSTVAEKSFLTSAGYLGNVFSSHAVGFLCDTWGRNKMLRTSLSLSLIPSIMSSLSVNIWMLIAFRFLSGVTMSTGQASAFTFIGEFHGSKSRTKYITMLSIFAPLGVMFLPAMGIIILPLQINWTIFGLKFHSWRLLLLVCSLLRIPAIIGFYLTPDTPKYDLMQGNHEKALQTLRTMFSKNMRKPECEYPVEKVSVEMSGNSLNKITGVKDALSVIWMQTVPLFYKDKVLHTLNISFILFIMNAIGQGLVMWLPTILKELVAEAGSGHSVCEIMRLAANASEYITPIEGNSTEIPVDTTMFEILIIIGAVISLSYLVLSVVIDYIGKKNVLVVWMLISCTSCLVLQRVTDFTWSVVLMILIASVSSSSGVLSTVALNFFPVNVNAMGMCLVLMIGRLGASAGSNVTGLMIYVHCDTMLYIYCGFCVLIAVLSLVLPYAGNV